MSHIWNWIDTDIDKLKEDQSAENSNDLFRYRNLREGPISAFVGDTMSYLSNQRGHSIRRS